MELPSGQSLGVVPDQAQIIQFDTSLERALVYQKRGPISPGRTSVLQIAIVGLAEGKKRVLLENFPRAIEGQSRRSLDTYEVIRRRLWPDEAPTLALDRDLRHLAFFDEQHVNGEFSQAVVVLDIKTGKRRTAVEASALPRAQTYADLNAKFVGFSWDQTTLSFEVASTLYRVNLVSGDLVSFLRSGPEVDGHLVSESLMMSKSHQQALRERHFRRPRTNARASERERWSSHNTYRATVEILNAEESQMIYDGPTIPRAQWVDDERVLIQSEGRLTLHAMGREPKTLFPPQHAR